MPEPLIRAGALGLLFILAFCFLTTSDSFAQRRKQALVCKQQALALLKPMPELGYECGDLSNDWDEKILELPARRDAIKSLTSHLSAFTDAEWWTAAPLDLNVCDFTKEPGALTTDQRRSFMDGEYLFWLF